MLWAWMLAGAWSLRVERHKNNRCTALQIEDGRLRIYAFNDSEPGNWSLKIEAAEGSEWRLVPALPVWEPTNFQLPLWLLVVVIGVPTAFLWWRYLRRLAMASQRSGCDAIQTSQPCGQMRLEKVTKLCRGCRYALDGLAENRCPECGERFDPTNPMTFIVVPSPKPDPVLRWMALVAIAVFAAFIIMFHAAQGKDGH
jgi:hypothetical protein